MLIAEIDRDLRAFVRIRNDIGCTVRFRGIQLFSGAVRLNDRDILLIARIGERAEGCFQIVEWIAALIAQFILNVVILADVADRLRIDIQMQTFSDADGERIFRLERCSDRNIERLQLTFKGSGHIVFALLVAAHNPRNGLGFLSSDVIHLLTERVGSGGGRCEGQSARKFQCCRAVLI